MYGETGWAWTGDSEHHLLQRAICQPEYSSLRWAIHGCNRVSQRSIDNRSRKGTIERKSPLMNSISLVSCRGKFPGYSSYTFSWSPRFIKKSTTIATQTYISSLPLTCISARLACQSCAFNAAAGAGWNGGAIFWQRG